MVKGTRQDKVIVGVDGSDASIEALRQAHRIASALGTSVEGWICWDFPTRHEAYEMMGGDGYSHQTSEILHEATTKAFGPDFPGNVRTRLVLGPARQSLIDASRFASMLVETRWQDWTVIAAGAYAALSVLWTSQSGSSTAFMVTLGVLLVAAGVTNLAMPGMKLRGAPGFQG